MDGHGSHLTGEIQYAARQNDVIIIWLLSHCSHLIQPLDQQPFAVLKSAYSQLLKNHDPAGDMKVIRATFNILWAQARGLAFTSKAIRSSWSRSGLVPFNLTRILAQATVANYRPLTPELQPDKTEEFRTPKRKLEWLLIVNRLRSVLPQAHRLSLTRIEHHLDELEAEVTLLRGQLKVYRKDARKTENDDVGRRIKKLNKDITTDLSDVMKHRGYGDDEIELATEV